MLLLATLLSSLLVRPAQATAPQPPVDLQAYARQGERVVTLEPGLRYNGAIYHVHCYTTGELKPEAGVFFFQATPEYFQQHGITGFLVTADDRLVEKEETLRELFSLYRAAGYLYERQPPDQPLGNVDDTFVNDLRAITRNPVFVEQQFKGLFTLRWEETAEALRGILTPQAVPPGAMEDFAGQVRVLADQGDTVVSAVDDTLEAARFSNSREVRELAKDVKSTFKSWRPVTEQGTSYVDLGGTRLEFANALDVLDLGIRLIWLAGLQQDRTQWLDDFAGVATGTAALDKDQILATATVAAETRENWVQRSDIILDFVRDQSVDLGTKLGQEALAKLWVKWSWNTFGKRTVGHLVAGAASAVLLGFTIGNLLYGLDDLFDNFTAGERADELRRRFHDGRLQLQEQARREKRQGEPYDGRLAAGFRAAYMLETLSAAQVHRAYSNGVEATVRKNLLALINPIAWFAGKEWRDAIQELRKMADRAELQAEEEIGHPAFVETAVDLTLARLKSPAYGLAASAEPGLIYDVVLPDERATLRFVLHNDGETTWTAAKYRLVATEGNPPGTPEALAPDRNVPQGATAAWSIAVPGYKTTGMRRISYRMSDGTRDFGDVVTGYVFVLPPQLKDAQARIREQIDELQRQGQQTAEELAQRAWEAIQAELERQAKELVDKIGKEAERQAEELGGDLLGQCPGSAALPMGIVLAGWFARRRMRR